VVEATAMVTAEAFGYLLTVVRPTAVYGPGQDPAKGLGAVAVFAQQILSGRPIHVFGSLDTSRDFLHVDDLAEAIVRLAARRASGTFEVGGPELVTLRTLIDELERVIGRRAIVEVTARTGLDRDSVLLDSTTLESTISWAPGRTVADQLPDVVVDVAARLDIPAPNRAPSTEER
jgi:UDP-glucose 4-epimerase